MHRTYRDLTFSQGFLCLFLARQPQVGQGLHIHEVSRSHTMTHHTRQDSSGRVISSSQRPLHDNTQRRQQTDIHALGEIRTHNLSRGAAADLRLRPCGHWDRHSQGCFWIFSVFWDMTSCKLVIGTKTLKHPEDVVSKLLWRNMPKDGNLGTRLSFVNSSRHMQVCH